MAAKFRPSEVSRESVQVELRDSTSISPDCRAVKRSLAESGLNFTLLASLKTAAAMARQRSTSRPVQLPRSSGLEKPGNPWLTPQTSWPRCFTALRVCADAGAPNPSRAANASVMPAGFMTGFLRDDTLDFRRETIEPRNVAPAAASVRPPKAACRPLSPVPASENDRRAGSRG